MIKTAVFVVAGMGTRFLPATKTIAKEMFPIVDKPLVQYAVEDALKAGATNLVFITSKAKKALEDFFDKDAMLEKELEDAGKVELLKTLQGIVPKNVQISFVRQTEPKGVAHALWCARALLENEPFYMLYPDDLIDNEVSACQQMHEAFLKKPTSILAAQEVPNDKCHLYGVMDIAKQVSENQFLLNAIVEKPKSNPPSNLAAVGRYIVTPDLFAEILKLETSSAKEWPMMDAWSALCAAGGVSAVKIKGTRYDCGSKLGYVQANISLALKHPEIGAELLDWLKNLD